MYRFIALRLMSLIPMLLAVYTLAFFIVYLVPGDPAVVMLGAHASPGRLERVRALMGLDRPLHVRYFDSLIRTLRGDLGTSVFLADSISKALGERIPVSVCLAVYALALEIVIGLPLGIIAAVRQNSLIDRAAMVSATFGLSIPGFWLGLLLIYLFALRLGWFRTGGWIPFSESVSGCIKSLTLPALSLAIREAAYIARMVRANMVEVLSEEYVTTARSKGLSEWKVVVRHALKNALIPVITVAGLSFGSLLGGTVVTETVFRLPGVGRFIIMGIQGRDYPIIQAALLFVGFCFCIINLLCDIMYALIDPRITYK